MRAPRPFALNSEMPCAIAEGFGALRQALVSLRTAHSGRGLVGASLDEGRPIWGQQRRVSGLMWA